MAPGVSPSTRRSQDDSGHHGEPEQGRRGPHDLTEESDMAEILKDAAKQTAQATA